MNTVRVETAWLRVKPQKLKSDFSKTQRNAELWWLWSAARARV